MVSSLCYISIITRATRIVNILCKLNKKEGITIKPSPMLKRLPRFVDDLKNNIWSELNNGILSNYHNQIINIYEEWGDKYSEHESNMPETDSAIEKWEEIHERMEDRLNAIREITELLEEIINNLENGGIELPIVSKKLDKLVDYMVEYQEEYKGLAKIV